MLQKYFKCPKYRLVETRFTTGSIFIIERKNNIFSKWTEIPFSFSPTREEAIAFLKREIERQKKIRKNFAVVITELNPENL